MKKRVVSMLLATCMLAVAIVGCGAGSAPQQATTNASADASGQEAAAGAS